MKRASKNAKKPVSRQRSLSSSSEDFNRQYVEAKRAKKKKTKKNPKIKTETEDSQVLEIYRGDSFHGEHVRPSFLKKWDGVSNTLELTEDDYDDMSPMMKVYWKHKSKNMNCIMFVQLGRIEFIAFENDALILHEIYKKPLRKFSKFIRCNFWSREIDLVKMELFQRHIPVLMLNEIRDAQFQQQNGLVKREITEVITPSIYLDYESKQYQERLMLCIYRGKKGCGIVCVDIESNKFLVQQYDLELDEQLFQIRRIINRYRPVELIVKKNDNEVRKMAKQICNPYIVELDLPLKMTLEEMIKEMKEITSSPFFKQMLTSYKSGSKKQDDFRFSYDMICQALYLVLTYMKNLQLQAKIFGQGLFEICSLEVTKLKPMFDAQVYENLQVFNIRDEEESFSKPGTLFHYLNHCQTNAGQKLLKKWINEPLREKEKIIQRQEAITTLLNNKAVVFPIWEKISAFKKLQRKIGNVYHWITKHSQQANLTKQLSFDKDYNEDKNPAVVRLKEIYSVLDELERVENFLRQFQFLSGQSILLKKIAKIVELPNLKESSLKKLNNEVPSIKKVIQKFYQKIIRNRQAKSIEPAKGQAKEFDDEKAKINKINEELDELLSMWRKRFDTPRVNYVSVRARNQLQVPLAFANKKKFKELTFSSQTSANIRYVVPDIQELSEELMKSEERLAKSYEPFLNKIIKQFCSYKQIWDLYVHNISAIDVLLSLAKVSSTMVPRCLPDFQNRVYSIENGFHPGLLQVKKQEKVTSNSFFMKDNERILLLSGPNMGGKSTLLRQACLLAIIAQIGCYVPAKSYEAPIFDQIFCRIGASDRIIEGKSTFFVELQETKRIIDQATPDSLVIIDQLGRGTSTYDGMALASAVLTFISEEITCFTLFSTHYYPLIKQFQLFDSVKCAKMGYQLEEQNIKFTYTVEDGVAERSFATQVAKQVGIDPLTIELADKKSWEMMEEEKLIKEQKDMKMEEMMKFLSE